KTLSISQAHLSLDAPLTPGEDNKLLDYLPDTTNPGPDDQIFEHALTESIEEVLATLKEREAKILRLYFGLEGQEPMTLEKIGTQLGITRERVRQIKEKALARLRHVSRARALESFLFKDEAGPRCAVRGCLRCNRAPRTAYRAPLYSRHGRPFIFRYFHWSGPPGSRQRGESSHQRSGAALRLQGLEGLDRVRSLQGDTHARRGR